MGGVVRTTPATVQDLLQRAAEFPDEVAWMQANPDAPIRQRYPVEWIRRIMDGIARGLYTKAQLIAARGGSVATRVREDGARGGRR